MMDQVKGDDRYELKRKIGGGGQGTVWLAEDTIIGGDVAIKVLHSETVSDATYLRNLLLGEARLQAQLSNVARPHPNIVSIIDVRRLEDDIGIVMEYVDGGSIADYLGPRNRRTPMGVSQVVDAALATCEALAAAHAVGIIHRDIKPGNLYAPAGNPRKAKIFDLGIAHDEEGTRTHGQVPGTLDFMPPEFATQTSGRGSAQSDIYSIGVTLYQALTKKLPFPRLPDKEAEAWIAFFRRSEKPLDCPFDHPVFKSHPELLPLLRRALAHDPKRRFESAGAMRDELKRILLKWGAPTFD